MSLKYLQSVDDDKEEKKSAATIMKKIFNNKGYDKHFKVIIIGDQNTGKTALLMRIGEGEGKALRNYDPTIGVDCRTKIFQHGEGKDAMKVRLQIWDTAGQERFRTLTTSYYRGTHCCILVFDITSQESFYHLYQWID